MREGRANHAPLILFLKILVEDNSNVFYIFAALFKIVTTNFFAYR